MTPTNRLWAVVPAAGRGSRFQGAEPKQYKRLAGRTVLEWSVSALLAQQGVALVVVALAEDDGVWGQLEMTADPRVRHCVGGDERVHSVLAGLEFLATLGADDQDRVLVHDAARPAVSPAAIARLIADVHDSPSGGLLALPVADTLKREESGCSAETLDRGGLWAAQTPQLYPLGTLRGVLRDACARGIAPTDEAAAMEGRGMRPRLVPGEPTNVKLTRREDRELLEAVLAAREGAAR